METDWCPTMRPCLVYDPPPRISSMGRAIFRAVPLRQTTRPCGSASQRGLRSAMSADLGRVDKAAFGDSPDAGRHDSKLTSVLEVSFGPGPVERRGMGVYRAICY